MSTRLVQVYLFTRSNRKFLALTVAPLVERVVKRKRPIEVRAHVPQMSPRWEASGTGAALTAAAESAARGGRGGGGGAGGGRGCGGGAGGPAAGRAGCPHRPAAAGLWLPRGRHEAARGGLLPGPRGGPQHRERLLLPALRVPCHCVAAQVPRARLLLARRPHWAGPQGPRVHLQGCVLPSFRATSSAEPPPSHWLCFTFAGHFAGPLLRIPISPSSPLALSHSPDLPHSTALCPSRSLRLLALFLSLLSPLALSISPLALSSRSLALSLVSLSLLSLLSLSISQPSSPAGLTSVEVKRHARKPLDAAPL